MIVDPFLARSAVAGQVLFRRRPWRQAQNGLMILVIYLLVPALIALLASLPIRSGYLRGRPSSSRWELEPSLS